LESGKKAIEFLETLVGIHKTSYEPFTKLLDLL
jgi:hypothetical protein